MDAATEIRKLGHIATRAQLVALGASGGDLTTAVRLGEIRRIRQGHYATPGASNDAVNATRVGGRLAGPSAARSYGLWAGFDDRLHVAIPHNASRLRTNVAPSRLGEISGLNPLTPDTTNRDVVLHWIPRSEHSECWRVSVREMVAQVVAWSDRETAIACLDTSRTILRLVDRLIGDALSELPARGRLLAARSCPGSDSGPESVVRQRLIAINVPVVQQVVFEGVGRVDMQVTGTNILIEIDGRQYHSDPATFENDRRRRNELVRRGYVVLQFSYRQIFGDWPWCESMILGAISQFRNSSAVRSAD